MVAVHKRRKIIWMGGGLDAAGIPRAIGTPSWGGGGSRGMFPRENFKIWHEMVRSPARYIDVAGHFL